MKKMLLLLISVLLSNFFISCTDEVQKSELSPYPEELAAKISRGLVCFQKEDDNNFLNWRLLPSDPDNATFFIWRKISSSKEANAAIIDSTTKNNYMDKKIGINVKYSYGISTDRSMPEEFQEIIKNEKDLNFNALAFDLKEDYEQANVVSGDLNGDGELEIVIIYSKMRGVDPFKKAWMKSIDTYKVAAFLRGGTRLWTLDLGWGIEAGPVYAPVIIWDLDSDGKSEIILKTSKSNNPKNYNEEYLTILNGENGEPIRETRWPEPPSNDYNSNSRNYLAVAHLDGKNPTIVAARGTYFKQVLCAYDLELNLLWKRFFGKDILPRFGNKYLNKIWSLFSNDQSRGSHCLPIADVDGNGTEEIFWGEHCITEGGEDLWEVTERTPYTGHLDIVFPADIIPNSPGLETYYCREGWLDRMDNIGILLVDVHGKTIWSKWGFTHVDGGWVAKVIPDENNFQLFAFDIAKKEWKPGQLNRITPTRYLFNIKGERLPSPDSTWVRSYPVDFEGDGICEIVTRDGKLIRNTGEVLISFKGELLWAGDIYGDHREELVYTPLDGKVYIVFNTDVIESPSRITRLADRRYKNDLSRTAMQFNVIPIESGYVPLLNKN